MLNDFCDPSKKNIKKFLVSFPVKQQNMAEKVADRLDKIVGMRTLKEQITKWTKSVYLDRKGSEATGASGEDKKVHLFTTWCLWVTRELGKRR